MSFVVTLPTEVHTTTFWSFQLVCGEIQQLTWWVQFYHYRHKQYFNPWQITTLFVLCFVLIVSKTPKCQPSCVSVFRVQNFSRAKNVVHLASAHIGCAKWKWGCVAWVWIAVFEVVEFGVASRVAPHLAGRFPGRQMEGFLRWCWETLRRQGPAGEHNTHTHTHAHTGPFSSPSSVTLLPCPQHVYI